MKNTVNKYLKYIGGFSIGPIVGAILSFITIPVITYFISPAEYGRISMFTLVQNIFGMIAYLGLDQAYVKFYHDIEDKNKLIIHTTVPSLVLSVLVSVFIYIFRLPLCYWLYGNTSSIDCVYILIPYLPFFVLERFILVRFRMEQKGLLYSIFSIFSKAFLLILSILLLKYYKCGYESIIYATVFAQVLTTIIMIAIYLKEEKLKYVKWDWKFVFVLLKFSLPLIPATLVGWMLNSLDKIMIRSICDYSQLGYYDAALKIVSVLSILQSCFSTLWSPIAFKWNKQNKDISYFEEVGRILGIIMLTLFVLVLIFKDIIINILSPEYYNAVHIVPFLLIYPIMYIVSEVTVMGIYFSGKSASTIIVSVVSCVLNVVLNSLLIPDFGAVGASIATGISYVIFFWMRTIISIKVWKKYNINFYILLTFIVLFESSINILIKNNIVVFLINIVILIYIVVTNYKYINKFVRKLKQ